MALLEVHNLVKAFGGLKANDDVSFSIGKGNCWGSSVRTAPARPPCSIASRACSRRRPDASSSTAKTSPHWGPRDGRRGLARTFQVYVAGGDLNVLENVMVGCFLHTRSQSQAKAKAEGLLEDLGLKDLKLNLVNELPVAPRSA